MNARELTSALGGKWYGRYGKARCPTHDDRNPSLTIRDGAKSLLLKCHAGCEWRDIISAIGALGLWKCHDNTIPWAAPEPVVWHTLDGAPKKTILACRIWQDAIRPVLPDTPAGKYLIGRGIAPPWPETLASGTLRHPETKETVSALIVARHCPVVGLVRGIHQIFVTEDGQKYPSETVKMSLGSITGGRAELISPERKLILCEGVESALSAWRLFKTPAWAMCGGFPSSIKLPGVVREVHIVADNDRDGKSEKRGSALGAWLHTKGYVWWLLVPRRSGEDINNVLLARDAELRKRRQ